MDNLEKANQLISIGGFSDQSLAAFSIFVLGVIFTIVWSIFLRERHKVTVKINPQELMLSTPDRVKGKVSMKYSGEEIISLHLFHATVDNTGNRGINNQLVRFDFPKDSVLLEEPEIDHEPLIGSVHILERSNSPLSITYMIEHFPIKTLISFSFVAKDCCDSRLNACGKNETNIDTIFLVDHGR